MKWIPIDQLQFTEDNPNEGDVGAIYNSIKQFGYREPVHVWQRDGTAKVKGGEHRLRALMWHISEGYEFTVRDTCARSKKGIAEIFCVDDSDFEDEVEANAFMLALNRTSRLGFDDHKKLLEMLSKINKHDKETMEGTGFSTQDLQDLIRFNDPPTLKSLAEEYGEHEPTLLYPIINVKIPPEIFQRFRNITQGNDDTERFIWIVENFPL